MLSDKTKNILKLAQVVAFIPPTHVPLIVKEISYRFPNRSKTMTILCSSLSIWKRLGLDMMNQELLRENGIEETAIFKNPLFGIDLWNVDSRIDQCLPMTNAKDIF